MATLTRAFHDDHIRHNADKRFRAGMGPKIVRTAAFNCCSWCSSLAGTYDYEDVRDTGNDVFRRHERCKCIVDYVCDGKSQAVWSKKYFEADEETLRHRLETKQKTPAEMDAEFEAWQKMKRADEATLERREIYRASTDASPEALQIRSEYGLETRRASPEEMAASAERARLYSTNPNNVDLRLLDSPGYRERFFGISGNTDVDEQIYRSAVEILEHRNGTNREDLHLIDATTGEVVHRRVASTREFGVQYDEETIRAIEDAQRQGRIIIAVHNHPNGLPPTLDDGSSARSHGYARGVVVGHNLEVWTYTQTKELLDETDCSMVHEIIAEKIRFELDFEEKVWYDELEIYGMEVERK